MSFTPPQQPQPSSHYPPAPAGQRSNTQYATAQYPSVPQPTQQRPIMSYVVPSRRAVTGLELLAILALPVVASLVAILISTIAMMLIFDDLKTIEVYVIPAALAGYGITLFTTLRVQRWSLSDLGFHPIKRTWAHLLWQVPAIITVCGMISLAATVLVTPPETSDSQEMADTFKFGLVAVVLSILAISIIGPIIEEICFRRFIMGYLDQKLLPRMQARTAIICSTLASSLFFALAHGVPTIMIYTFFLGIGAAALIRWHQSLWAGVAIHIANNTMVCLAGLSIYLNGMLN